MKLMSAADAAKKWTTRAGAASGDYASGVKDAGPTWEANTGAAASTYAQGVQAAIGNNSFAKGVSRAGGARYAGQAASLGASRYGGGVQAATATYASKIQPVLDTIQSLQATAPKRGPKGDPSNYEISKHFGQGLRAKKVAGF